MSVSQAATALDSVPPLANGGPRLNWITLYDEPVPVASPVSMLYSTAPGMTYDTSGRQYFIKGPDVPTVVAEAAAYQLATIVGLDVPDWGLWRHPVDRAIRFGSQGVRIRSGIEQFLRRPELTVNRDLLSRCVVFDVWISNRDRNIGGIVAEPVGGRQGNEVRLYAIDFEKSDVLRGTNRFEITAKFTPSECWPREALRPFCTNLVHSVATCAKIKGVTKEMIAGIFDSLSLAGLKVDWAESASDYLAWRGTHIDDLVAEAWNAQSA